MRRVRGGDRDTVRDVLSQFRTQPPLSIGLIVNKVTPGVVRALREDPSATARIEQSFVLGGHRIGSVLFVRRETELNDAPGCLIRGHEVVRLRAFVTDFRATIVRRPPSAVEGGRSEVE